MFEIVVREKVLYHMPQNCARRVNDLFDVWLILAVTSGE